MQDLDFKDAIIDAFTEAMIRYERHPFCIAPFIYPSSQDGSSHRQLATDTVVHLFRRFPGSNEYDYLKDADTPREFLLDLLRILSPLLTNGTTVQTARSFFANKEACHYHDHGNERPCYKMRFDL